MQEGVMGVWLSVAGQGDFEPVSDIERIEKIVKDYRAGKAAAAKEVLKNLLRGAGVSTET